MYRLAAEQEYVACHYYSRLHLSYYEEQQETPEKRLSFSSFRVFLSVNVSLQYGYEDYPAYPYREHRIERRHRRAI